MQYCAFIRAINVGRHNRIRMEELRRLCGAAGLGDPATYLQTGNVLFETAEPAEDVATRLESAFIEAGLRNAAAIVRSHEQLAALVAANPLATFVPPEYMRWVALARQPLSAEATAALAAAHPHAVAVGGDVCWAELAGTPNQGGVNAFVETKLKVQATTRYLHVVEEVARLLGERAKG